MDMPMFNKLAVIAVLTTVLTACGGSSTPETPPPQPPTGPVTPPPVANADIGKAFVFANARVLQPLGFGVTALNNQSVNPSPALSNLVAVSPNGSSRLAVNFELPVAVTHTQLTPDNRHVYVALDSALNGASGPYAAAIGRYNCAIYRVNLSTDKASCVAEGVIIDSLQDDNNNHGDRPLRFDNQTDESGAWVGASYFVGHTFESTCAASDTKKTNCSLVEDRTRKLYRLTYDGQLSEISTSLSFFFSYQVLANGHVVIHGHDETIRADQLWLYHPNGETTLVHQGRMSTFSADDNNTFLYRAWGGYEPLQAVEVANDGSFTKVPLQVSTLRHLLTSEDGKLYAVNNNFELYRILPQAEAPLLRFEKPRDMEFAEWWSSMQATPILITDGFALVIEPELVANAGRIEHIWLVNLATGEHDVLLGSDSSAFKARIYNWRLSGDSLFFSALNQATGETVLGELDIAAARDGKAQRDYLKLTVIGSADDPIIHPSDIEVIRPQQQGNTGVSAKAAIKPERLNGRAIGLSFSNAMQRESVAQALKLEDSNGASIDMVSLWLGQHLHLLPDTYGLDANGYAPLVRGADYTLYLDAVIRDMWHRPFDYLASGFDANQRYNFSIIGSAYYHLQPYVHKPNSGLPLLDVAQQLNLHKSQDHRRRLLKLPFIEVNQAATRFDFEWSIVGAGSIVEDMLVLSDYRDDGHDYQLALEYSSSTLLLTYHLPDGSRKRLRAELTHDHPPGNSYRNLKLTNTAEGLRVWFSFNDEPVRPVWFLDNFTEINVIRDIHVQLTEQQSFYLAGRNEKIELVKLRLDLYNESEPFELETFDTADAPFDDLVTIDYIDTSYTEVPEGTAQAGITRRPFNGESLIFFELRGMHSEQYEVRLPGSHGFPLTQLESFSFDVVLNTPYDPVTVILGDAQTSLIEIDVANQVVTLDYMTREGMQRVSSDPLDVLRCCELRLFRLVKQGDILSLSVGDSEDSLQRIPFHVVLADGSRQRETLSGADFSNSGVVTASLFSRMTRFELLQLGGVVFRDGSGELMYNFEQDFAELFYHEGWVPNTAAQRERIGFADIELRYINELSQQILFESLVHFKVGETARMPLPQVEGFTLSHVTGCAGSREGDDYLFDVVDTTGCTIEIWYQP